MEQDLVRDEYEAQIAELLEVRDEAQSPDERAAASEAIDLLQDEVDRLNIEIADNLGDAVDEIIERLDEILKENSLDAVSALGRTIQRLRDLRNGRTGGE